jgi:hypothetical protein
MLENLSALHLAHSTCMKSLEFRVLYLLSVASSSITQSPTIDTECGMNVMYMIRVAKQRFRESRIQFQDYIILLMAGACVGVLSNMDDTNLGAGGYFYTLIALGKLKILLFSDQNLAL